MDGSETGLVRQGALKKQGFGVRGLPAPAAPGSSAIPTISLNALSRAPMTRHSCAIFFSVKKRVGGVLGEPGAPPPAAERGGPGQSAAAGRRVLGLVAQAGGREDGGVLQDVHDGLQLLRDMVLQQAGRHHRGPGPRVAVEQRPVVAGNAF